MKKGLFMFLALVIAGTISLTACQKKEEPAMPPASEMEESETPPMADKPSYEEEAPSEEQPEGHSEESE